MCDSDAHLGARYRGCFKNDDIKMMNFCNLDKIS